MAAILHAGLTGAQDIWTAERCIQYAVEHNHDVRIQRLSLDDSRTERLRARGAFLPSLGASTSAQYNFGRAIDPETNTYTNVSTFYNGYSVSASIPVFDGLQRWNSLQTARLNVLLGRQGLLARKDDVARRVLRQYIDALYYTGTCALAEEKRKESLALLGQARAMAEVGLRSGADTAQMHAAYAADDYEVTRQQNLLSSAMLTLKQLMNYPADEPLVLDSAMTSAGDGDGKGPAGVESAADITAMAMLTNPTVKTAELNLQTAVRGLRAARGAFFPSVSLGAGVSTTYYKQVGSRGGATFSSQIRNNAGEYVYASLSVPLFNRLGLMCNLRRQRNGVVRARESLDASRTELRRLVEEAVNEHRAGLAEAGKMLLKVEADSLAAHVAVRRFEEGLASPLDVQTATVALLQSRAALLQSRLGLMYAERMLNYYKGIPLWTEL